MATWYAQLSSDSFFSVSSGTTSDMWNSAANGSGSWLDTSSDYSADTFNSNGKTAIAIDANVTAALLTSEGGSGTWLINTDAVKITANLVAGTVATFLMNSGTPTVTIEGDLTGGSTSNDYCVELSVAGTVNVEGNVTGGGGSSAHGIYLNSVAGTVNVTGTVTGGSNALAYGINATNSANNAVIAITGSVIASMGMAVVAGGAGVTSVSVTSGNIVDTATVNAVLVRTGTFLFAPGATNYYEIRTAGSTTVKLYSDVPAIGNVTADDTARGVTGTFVVPAEADVESGVQYGADGTEFTGTFVGEGSGAGAWRTNSFGVGV